MEATCSSPMTWGALTPDEDIGALDRLVQVPGEPALVGVRRDPGAGCSFVVVLARVDGAGASGGNDIPGALGLEQLG